MDDEDDLCEVTITDSMRMLSRLARALLHLEYMQEVLRWSERCLTQ